MKPLVPERRNAIAYEIAESVATNLIHQVFDEEGWEEDVTESLVMQWMIADLIMYCVASRAIFEGIDAEAIRDRALGITKLIKLEVERKVAATGVS